MQAIDNLVLQVWEDPATDLKCLTGESRLAGQDLFDYIANSANVTLVNETADASITGVVFLTGLAKETFDLGVIAYPTGQGVGSVLIDMAVDVCNRRGVTEIRLDVFARNRALTLYKRKGFVQIDECSATNQRGEELTLLRMKLSLPGPFADKSVVKGLKALLCRFFGKSKTK